MLVNRIYPERLRNAFNGGTSKNRIDQPQQKNSATLDLFEPFIMTQNASECPRSLSVKRTLAMVPDH